ncbi:MAG: alpha/beta fold hydrolase [Candidatus Obscuribacterales bacterium]|nr:alpha/beta fold hydrolase [Candidatus Obscuribacterales bacterium]
MKSFLPESRHPSRNIRPRRSAGSMGQAMLGNIYEALTGLRPVPSGFIRRAVANGLDKDHLADAIRRAKSAHKLPDYMLAMAERKRERAHYWDELGLKPRARENYLESAFWGIYAEILTTDPVRKAEIHQQYSQSYLNAAPHLSPPATPVSIGFVASTLSGYLRKPGGTEETVGTKVPCVVVLNGLCSPKEELHYVENSLLARGFATLSMDYPGQAGSHAPGPFDVAEFATSLCLFLSTRPEIDCSRLSLYGISLGARIALFMAIAFPDRFNSVVSISAPYDLIGDLDQLTPAFARELLLPGLAVRKSLQELAHQTPIEETLDKITIPVLVAGGGKDLITLPEETRYIFEQINSADKKLLLCPGANHNLYEMMPSIRYEIAQWLWQRT